MNTNHAWYIRHKGNIEGPFPAGQIKQELLLGRYRLDNEVSHDKENWQTIKTIRSLIPDVLLTDRDDPDRKERISAARRWADERRVERRGDKRQEGNGRERRDGEPYESVEYRFNREVTMSDVRARRNNQWKALAGLIVFIGIIIYAAFTWVPAPEKAEADCEAIAGPAVNWSHCRMAGLQSLNQNFSAAIMQSTDLSGANFYGSNLNNAQLSYADLGGAHLRLVDFTLANLKGASLRNADLTNANFSQADLSYVDLTDATIEDADFSQAKLDSAIWVDGKKCQAGSVGRCM